MRGRHQCMWVTLACAYTPPAPIDHGAFRAWDPPTELVRQSMFGITVITLRCTGCGDVAYRKTIGDGRIPDFLKLPGQT